MQGFERNGLVFDVRDGGPPDGDVVVLLHGFPQTSAAWDRVEPLLHGAGLRTLAPDQRGYSPGARPSGRTGYTLSELAADVLALLDAAGCERAHVAGHDWGGALAWWLGFHHPQRVRSLTVLSTPHPKAMAQAALTSPQLLRSSYVALFQLPGVAERLLDPTSSRRWSLGDVLRRSGLDDHHAERYQEALAEPRALTGALSWYRALPLTRPDRAPGRITVPTRYLWGRHDRFLGRRAAELTERYVDGDYRFVPLEVGHWIPEQAPEAAARATIELATP